MLNARRQFRNLHDVVKEVVEKHNMSLFDSRVYHDSRRIMGELMQGDETLTSGQIAGLATKGSPFLCSTLLDRLQSNGADVGAINRRLADIFR